MNLQVEKRNNFNVWALSGVLAVVFYLAHVIAGRLVWVDYNPLAQPISDLTAGNAPSQAISSKILYGYNFFNLLFCVVLLLYFKRIWINRVFYAGLILKALAELLSTFGYLFFPLADTNWGGSFQNIMHYAITGVIVFSYIVLSVLLARGLQKTRKYQKMTRFLSTYGVIFIVSGISTVIAANNFPDYVGLMERINLYSLMGANLGLALWVFKDRPNLG